MQELNKGGTKNLKYSNIYENISLWGIFLDSYQQCGKMGWSLAQDCRFILRLTIYTLAKWAFYIFSNVHTKLFTGVSHFVTFTCIHVLSPQVGRTSTRWRDGQKTYERGESGRQTRPGNDRSWADATCILHLLQSALRTNEILIGQQIIARVKTHCTDADLTIDYLPPRWPDSLRLSKLTDILKRAD